MPLIPPSPFLYRVKGSYFSECERDDEGHCLPSGEAGAEKPEERKKPPGLVGEEGSDGPGKVAGTRKEERQKEDDVRREREVEHARDLARATAEGSREGADSISEEALETIAQFVNTVDDVTGYRKYKDPRTKEGRRLSAALEELPRYEGTVHRGLVMKTRELKKLLNSGILEINQFNSATLGGEEVAESFAKFRAVVGGKVVGKPVILELRSRGGATDISSVVPAGYEHQKEAIVRPGTKWKIVGHSDSRGVTKIRLEEVESRDTSSQIPPSPFRKRLPLILVKALPPEYHSPEDDPIKVHLPDLSQHANYTCGASAMESICEFFGVGPETEEEFMQLLGSDPEEGTNPQRIIDLGMQYGLGVDVRQGMTIDDLKAHLDQEHPILVLIQAWGEEADEEQNYPRYDDGHYVVVVGYDAENIYVEDPSLKGARGVIEQQDFLERWHDEGRGKRYERWGAAFSKQHEYEEVKSLVGPSPFWYRAKGSYFGECERDDEGHCLPSREVEAEKPKAKEEAKAVLAKMPGVRYLGIKDAVRTPLKVNEEYPIEIDSLLKPMIDKVRSQRDGWSALKRAVPLDELVAIQGAVSRSGVEKKIDDSQSGLTKDPPNNLGLVVQYQGVKYVWDGTHRIAAAALQGQPEVDTYFINLDDTKHQIPPSPFRKRLPLFLAKDLSYLDETAGGVVVPPPKQKDVAPKPSALERAEHSDLITLPDGIEGTNCGNCEYIRETFCVHPEVNQEVTPRMCCAYWNSPGTHRAWEQEDGKKNVNGFLTKATGTCKPGQRSDLTGCQPSEGEAGTPPSKEGEEPKQSSSSVLSQLGSMTWDALKKAGHKIAHVEHAAKEWLESKIGERVSKLPPTLQKYVRGAWVGARFGTKAAFATYTAGQKAAELVAKERGATPEQLTRLRSILSAVDIATFKPVSLAVGLAATPAVAGAASFIPIGSMTYLAYSTARDPLATIRAARKAVRGVTKKVTGEKGIKGSYFAECERDEGGQCLPSGRAGQQKPPGMTGMEGSEGPDKVAKKRKRKREVETEERREREVEHARNLARATEEGKQEAKKPKKSAASRGEMAEARREGKGKEAKIVMGDGNPAPEHIKASMVPPDWTEVKVSLDPKADVLVTARDKAGRIKTVYSDQHHMRQAALKFARIREYQIKRREMFQQNQRNRQGKNKEEADCAWLMMVQGTRPGSDKDVKARVKAYGATTLRAEHVVIGEDGSVRLQFTGKEGVYHNHLIRDKQLAEMLKERAYSADERGGKLFDTSADRVQSYSRTLDGGSFTPKDFRTGRANNLAVRLIGDMDTPTDEKSYKKAVKQVAERVSSVLGNRPAQALESYIDPTVFSGWRNYAGV